MKTLINTTLIIFGLLISNIAYSQCFDEGHSPFKNQGWLSCNTSTSPIPERGDVHWIMYDLGEVYPLDSIKFWNHNVWGETGMGIKEIIIDYSKDLTEWSAVGPIDVDKAPGSWRYTGTNGPSLQNAKARYVHFTVLSTWDESSSCAGLAEIRFNIGEFVNTQEEKISTWDIGPNPASEYITLNNPDYAEVLEVTIYNSVGQKIKSIFRPSGSEMTIPIADLLDGIYFLSLYSVDGVSTKSFVKR